MRDKRLIVVILAVAALAVAPTFAGARSVTARPAAITATHAASVTAVPKFVFHAGLAFGAFHLKLVVAPLTAVVAVFNTIVSTVKAHKLDAATVASAQSDVTTIEGQAKGSGSLVTEAVPSAKQILAGFA